MTSSLGEALKSALAKQWASDDEAHNKMEAAPVQGRNLFKPTSNITRATFDEIRDNPAERIVIQYRLKQRGFSKNSVSSLITQMLRQNMVTVGSDGKLYTTIPEYVPLRPWRHTAPAKSKIVLRKKQAKPVAEKKEEKPVKEERRPVSTPSPVWSVDDVLTQLNILEARAVYDALHKIFGGAK